MTDYLVYDVFTDRAFGGNQLAVIPDAAHLPEHLLQIIAREFNYSESTFVYPPTSADHTAKVRIFTPNMEVPFAGHPTIGTAVALSDLGYGSDLVLELGVGPIAAKVSGNSAEFTTHVPLQTFGQPEIELVARALGLPETSIRLQSHPPVQAGVGLDFVMVELTDRAQLSAISLNIDGFREGRRRYPSGLDFAIMAYCRDGDQLDARMFAPLDDIPEDPATGSACAALGAMLGNITGQSGPFLISQGQDMGRPSKITVTLPETGGVTVAGQAVQTMRGSLILSPRDLQPATNAGHV